MKLTLSRIAAILSSRTSADQTVTGYSIDSRTIRLGELFFAVQGESMDGHDFVQDAFDRGAAAAVVRSDKLDQYKDASRLIAVDDTLKALQTLAAEVRSTWGRSLIGVTGSAGKTTTKEAIAQVLSSRFKVLKNAGNFNNHFGLPLTLLKLEPDDDMAVIEMGMSHSGEIQALAEIARPDIGVVTVVAPVHLENFRSLADIARAKYELVASLPPTGTAILNADDEYVSKFGRDFPGRVITYGFAEDAFIRASGFDSQGENGSTFDVMIQGITFRGRLPLLGLHNVYNALAAIATGIASGIEPTQAITSVATLIPADKRGEVIHLGNITVINDCYNSNPRALDSMVDALAAMSAGRRIVVAGEMLELGPAAADMHRQSGRHLAEKQIDVLIGVRGMAEAMVEAASQAGSHAEFMTTPEAAGQWLQREARDGDVVLLKASRGVKLERALETWQTLRSNPSSGDSN